MRQTLTTFDNGPSLLAAIARQRLQRDAVDLEFRLPNLRISCPNAPGALVPVYEVFAEDAYRLEWFTAGLRNDLRAIDIGGHVGCFSLAFATLHPGARMQVFEASPTTAAYTRRNIEANGLADRVTVNSMAVSSVHGSLLFADNAVGSGLNGINAPQGTPAIEVSCVTFGEAISTVDGQADVVKIDTEGAEYDIVLGSDPADWADVQRVVMEYHPVTGHSWDELEEFFRKAGLDVVRHEAVAPGLGTVWLSRTPLAQPTAN